MTDDDFNSRNREQSLSHAMLHGYEEISMKIVSALSVLKKEMDMMGMDMYELSKFIDNNPLAVPKKTLEAYKEWKIHKEVYYGN